MISVNQVVTETLAVRAYEHQLTNIKVVTALASGLPQIFADAHQIQQVLLNLIINAEQAMLSTNGRGSLVLRTWHDVERALVALEVTDDGPGVPVDMQDEDLRSLFHDEGRRRGHRARTDSGVRDRPGARRPDTSRLSSRTGCVVCRWNYR